MEENMINNTNNKIDNNNNLLGGSRWNPTKEQIDMLENLYRQGLRTPTAEQIQQITSRLRAFGHIEGKNVFYWFQNHKARQRQKQKQENLAFYNRTSFFHPPPHFPPFQNVVCSPCYIPQVQNQDLGFYQQQYPKVPLPAAGGFKRMKTPENIIHERNKQPLTQIYNKDHEETNLKISSTRSITNHHHHQETLELFPMHPTGIMEAKNGNYDNDHNFITEKNSNHGNDSCILGTDEESPSGNNADHPYFDFFHGKLN